MINISESSHHHSIDLYINLMKKSLLNLIYRDENEPAFNIVTNQQTTLSEVRQSGLDWPERAFTMIGMQRLNNVQACVEAVIKKNIPGDFIEAGVWRGGTCIFMRALLEAYQIKDRIVWVADSFDGLPKPNEELYPLDRQLDLSEVEELKISLEQVQQNFRRYGLLDDQVKFLEGWFKDTLHNAEIEEIAILRLDGDLYESTIDTLHALYPKLVDGGYIIIDDYDLIDACKQAVLDYRNEFKIHEEIIPIDGVGVFWQKQSDQTSASIDTIHEQRIKYNQTFEYTLKEWMFHFQRDMVFHNVTWMGINVLKNPLDLWNYQEIIYETKPDIIVEIGRYNGGSTLFLAQLLELIDHGQIISIEIDPSRNEVDHPRIIDIYGDCSSEAIVSQVKELCSEKSVMVIHDGDHRDQSVLRDLRLYAPLVSYGHYFIVEDTIVDIYPAKGAQGFEPRFRDKGPLWAINQFLLENTAFQVDHNREGYTISFNPNGYLKRIKAKQDLELSIIVIVYNMQREAPRCLHSLTMKYQNVKEMFYEVIVVENNSSMPLLREDVQAFGSNFRYFYLKDTPSSPAYAINFGVEQAQADKVAIIIDGARILSPNILNHTMMLLRTHPNPIISVLGRYLGDDWQPIAITQGYNQQVEDKLLDDSKWLDNGYNLLDYSVLDPSSHFGWFIPSNESTFIALNRSVYYEIGGFDERFSEAGGGMLNADFFRLACEHPDTEMVILLGEATFHQYHGGASSGLRIENLQPAIDKWVEQYRQIRKKDWKRPIEQMPLYCGRLSDLSSKLVVDSIKVALSNTDEYPRNINRKPKITSSVTHPVLSIIVFIDEHDSQFPYMLHSLSTQYQQIPTSHYKVLVIDSGSKSQALREKVNAFGSNFRYRSVNSNHESWGESLYNALDDIDSDMIGIFKDGTYILTPRVIEYVLNAKDAFSKPLFYTLRGSIDIRMKYGWLNNGYSLYKYGDPGYSQDGSLLSSPSSCVFGKTEVVRALLSEYVNQQVIHDLQYIELFGDLYELTDNEVILLFGEACLHQTVNDTNKTFKDDYVDDDIPLQLVSVPLLLGHLQLEVLPWLDNIFTNNY